MHEVDESEGGKVVVAGAFGLPVFAHLLVDVSLGLLFEVLLVHEYLLLPLHLTLSKYLLINISLEALLPKSIIEVLCHYLFTIVFLQLLYH